MREFISEFSVDMPELPALIPIFAVAIICMMISMNQISAPSISLEGKNIWILQSLPIDTKEILNAKLNLHTALNAPVAALTAVALGYVIEADESICHRAVEDRMGDFRSFNLKQPSCLKKGKILSVWIDHGVQPKNASYRYWVLPATTRAELLAFSAQKN